MWHSRSLLMRSIIAAKVVDFPEPVGPVIRTSPEGRRARRSQTRVGRCNSSEVADDGRDHAEGCSHTPALKVNVYTEAADVGNAERKVQLPHFLRSSFVHR